ncbi:MAG: hypothetical protein KME30_00880 [Iphinoe sp. HA4291-MV1]|jgi:hypothetical protein|nr:hypothetical protein [Iphinoe sp. HA4291-MV1]
MCSFTENWYKAEVTTRKTEVAIGKAEVAIGKAEVAIGKAEVATGKAKLINFSPLSFPAFVKIWFQISSDESINIFTTPPYPILLG